LPHPWEHPKLAPAQQKKQNLARSNWQSRSTFHGASLGLLAGLGRKSAVADILGLRFSGFFAWWLWRTVYLMKPPGFERKGPGKN